jgi:hypothetical protein
MAASQLLEGAALGPDCLLGACHVSPLENPVCRFVQR